MAGMLRVSQCVDDPQIETLQRLGCQFMQGYYFGKPMKPADFDSLPERFARAG